MHTKNKKEALLQAAKRGKRVTCLVELRARFDEENNIDWSIRLEEAGCRVIYGLPDYKVHAKLLLIDLNPAEPGGENGSKGVVQIGTGNFNENTASQYTDLALFTAKKEWVDDVREIFRCLEAERFPEHCKKLLVAPLTLKPQILSLIDEEISRHEAGKPAEIVLKLNALTDRELCKKLQEAASAGVRVRLMIRGICCLVPEKGTDIIIRSIVGRHLEHSRIYAFGTGSRRKFYISSADFMTRNTMQRVEAAAPVEDPRLRTRLAHLLALAFLDTVKARELQPNGKYIRVAPKQGHRPLESQQCLYLEAKRRAKKHK